MKWQPGDKGKIVGLVYQFMNELKEQGFLIRKLNKIDFNTSFSTNGYCRTYRDSYMFDLGISVYRILDGWDAVKETILHELCHAMASYDSGHDEEWQELAKRVGDIYGIKITHTAPHSIKTYESAYKYVIKCDNCGATARFMRRTKFVKDVADHHATNWKCGCGHHHFSLLKGE